MLENIISFFVAVMAGVVCHYIIKWLDGADRKKRLEAAGYNYVQVQAAVKQLC